MTDITATQAARGFKDMLDRVERDESFTILRGGRPVARLTRAPAATLGEFRTALAHTGPDPDWADLVDDVHGLVDTLGQDNPWQDA